MHACRYIAENGSAAMLATPRLAGVTPKVNLWECVKQMHPQNVNNADYSGFETQRKHHQK